MAAVPASSTLYGLTRRTSIQYHVDILSCQHCVRASTEAIRAHDAYATVAMDLASKQVAVSSALPAEHLIAALGGAGYPARLLPAAD